MSNLLRIVASLLGMLALQLGGMDMAIAQQWASAKVVKYRVEGVHNGREAVVYGDYEGKADVIDRITIEFSWDTKKRKIIGPVSPTVPTARHRSSRASTSTSRACRIR
jgi:hypothetical protein